ncbi:RICIN domain-containing protein [Streptomyces chartreusis]|uniref:RICIN domain-containing protein n=1 Tax=Streptomyces chartreusis TaxID=1969 RepID=UPI002E18A04E
MQPHLTPILRLLAAPFITLLTLTAGAAGTAQATEPSAGANSDAWTFSTTNGRRLDVQNGNTGDDVFIVANNTPGYHQDWRLIPLGNGEFEVANVATGKCLSETFPLRQQSCGKTGQQWHFRPVNGKANTFTLVRSTNDRCLDIVQGAQHPDAWTQVYGCNGTKAQEWIIPASRQPEAMRLATEYYSHLCSTNASTCSWRQASEGGPKALPREKASSVWYNDTSDRVTQVFTTIYRSGWSQSFSAGVSTSVGVSLPMQAMVSSQLSATVTYHSDETEINGVAVTVPPKHYGWVDFAAVAKTVTGTWTFDKGRSPWTSDGTVTVPVVDSSAGSTMYIAHTGSAPPGATPSTGDDSTQTSTFAATTSQTFQLPAGTHLVSYKNGVKFTDNTGKTLATILPGVVEDINGTAHNINASVSGNTITQTIEGVPAGETVKGTMTPPISSLASGAPTAFSTSPIALLSDDGKKEWAKCMNRNMTDGLLMGGVMGIGGGAPGVVSGAFLGTVGGSVLGFKNCGVKP